MISAEFRSTVRVHALGFRHSHQSIASDPQSLLVERSGARDRVHTVSSHRKSFRLGLSGSIYRNQLRIINRNRPCMQNVSAGRAVYTVSYLSLHSAHARLAAHALIHDKHWEAPRQLEGPLGSSASDLGMHITACVHKRRAPATNRNGAHSRMAAPPILRPLR